MFKITELEVITVIAEITLRKAKSPKKGNFHNIRTNVIKSSRELLVYLFPLFQSYLRRFRKLHFDIVSPMIG